MLSPESLQEGERWEENSLFLGVGSDRVLPLSLKQTLMFCCTRVLRKARV